MNDRAVSPLGVTLEGNEPAAVSSSSSRTPTATVLAKRYEILGMLGAGGMGCVYRALDRELDETVALKMLHPELITSDEMLERFRQEVRLARRVTHRNVARMFDIGEHEGARFLTMELVEGESLSALLTRRGALPLGEVVALAQQLCEGLEAAHGAGVVHRDLKPDNVLIEAGGRAVITDFGIARGANAGAPTQTGGRVVGTPAYMAPEQVAGQHDLDARADLYALGAMLYEMCTGEPAWPGDSALAVAAARLLRPPPDPRQRCPWLDPHVAALVLRCMARDRGERPPSARAVREALAAVEAQAEEAPPASLRGGAPRVAALPRRERSVAVMPFRNAGAPGDAHWAEGLREDLADALSVTPGLRVSARRPGGAQESAPAEAWKQLGVDVVVEGSVRRQGDTLRVSARLIGADDGYQLWAGRFERPTASAFALNDDVAAAITAALSARQEAPQRQSVADPRAIELYFRARHEIGMFWSSASDRALERLAEAFALAPEHPTILAAYVSARVKEAAFGGARLDDHLQTAVDQAVARAPHLGEPWVALANLRNNHLDDSPGAARALRRAVRQSPSLADAYDLAGRLLLEAAEVDEAMACLDRALWLDPLLPFARIDRARAAALHGRWDEAMATLEARKDADWQPQISLSRLRYSLWRPEWRDTPAPQVPTSEVLPLRGMVELFLHARDSRAFTTRERSALDAFIASTPPRSRGRRLFTQIGAEITGSLGQHDLALGYVRQSVEQGLHDLLWLRLLPVLDGCRAHPAFAPLLAQVEARAAAVTDAWHDPAD